VRVQFELPDDVWWRFTQRAEEAGYQAREYFAHLISTEVVTPRSEQITESVLRLHHAGLTVPMIARRLNMTNSAVQTRLYSNGLRANKRNERQAS
jgi:DNA-binding NarL/FixJ family response regulator